MAEKGETERMINLDPFFRILYYSILIFLLILLCCIAIFWDMSKGSSIQILFIIGLIISILGIGGLLVEYLDNEEGGSDHDG